MFHSATVKLTLVAVMALAGLGILGGVAGGQVATPAAGTPLAGAEAGGLSAAEQAYLDAMTPIVTIVQDSLGRYTTLAEDPQLLNLDWLAKFAFEVMLWRSAYEDVLAIEPPPAFAESHGRYLEALGLFAETSDDVNAAFNDGDLVAVMQVGAKITQATRLFDQATALMAGVVSERGGVNPVASPAAATPVASQSASAPGLARMAWYAAEATPLASAEATPPASAEAALPAGEVSGQVNVMVEVNTFVGLGDLSTGEHNFQLTKDGGCEGASDAP